MCEGPCISAKELGRYPKDRVVRSQEDQAWQRQKAQVNARR